MRYINAQNIISIFLLGFPSLVLANGPSYFSGVAPNVDVEVNDTSHKPTSVSRKPPTSGHKKFNIYVGLASDTVKLDEKFVPVRSGDVFPLKNKPDSPMGSIGYTYSNGYNANFWDVAASITATSNGVGQIQCSVQQSPGSTIFITSSCGVESNLHVATIPVTYNVTFANSFLFAGAGVSLYRIKQDLSSGIDGTFTDTNGQQFRYSGNNLYKAESKGLAPTVQLGINLKKIRLKGNYTAAMGNDKTGKGDSTKLSLEYVFGKPE